MAANRVRITYIRWSMTIIEMNGLVIITDPVFRLLGLLRAAPRAYTLEQLPTPDMILVSHRHFDHWDPWTMRRLPRDTPLVVRPRRIADDARRLGYAGVRELHPWEETEVKGVTVTAVANTGYVFVTWSGDVPSAKTNDNPVVLTMDQPRTVTATAC